MKTSGLRLVELHWGLLLAVTAIAFLGCYNLHSAAAHHDPRLFMTQAVWFGLGLVGICIVLAIDYRVSESLAYVLYAVVCAMLLAVLLTGKSAMGARRWLNVGPITFQPSEIAKIATIFCMARYFSTRVPAGGYSIKGLARPLNPTRPLACIGAVLVGWNKPWLVDPLGELARGIHHKLGQAVPEVEDLLWFRAALLGLSCLSWSVALLGIVRAERAQALLHPWPPGRRRRLLALTTLLFASVVVGLVSAWHADVLADPFGVAIRALNRSALPGAVHAQLQPSLVLRALALGAGLTYLVASLTHARATPQAAVDLVVAPLDLLALPALLVLVEPDLGTAGIIILIGMTIILIVGVRMRSLIILGILGALISGVAWFGILKDYQKRRILTFIDPEQDIKGAGWNAVQSLIAVGSGRWLGKGHMEGTQTQLSFLPEQHTDFAFSVWAEEQGFAGCALLLLLYFVLLSLAFAIAAEARDTYGVLLATGVAALILWQAVINIGMVIGVLPVVGITLPLFSYGGSSVLTVMLCVGLLLNIHWRRRAH
jgi:cell division protein FtsW (lipid II flippase)